MKSVLISIQPKWCELIASGKKTVEVRKTKPKIEAPFKCYIYCTQGDALAYPCINNPKFTIHRTNNGTVHGKQMTAKEREKSDHLYANGKVIGEFVCNEIDTYNKSFFDEQEERDTYDIARFIYHSQIKYDDLCAYVGLKDFYAWHISDLVIYDEPRELCEFYKPCENLINGSCKTPYPFNSCGKIGLTYERFGKNGEHHRLVDKNACLNVLHRPPQSWCYVESEDTE